MLPGSGVHNRVSRFTADPANPDVAAAGSEQDLLDLNPLSSATNHNGGALHFGLDGDLYVGVGENANPANSQTLGNLLGKVLRLDVAQVAGSDPANSPKLIPADNPFVGQAAGINQLIYALGFRNPFTFGVQPGTGVIFIDDVGQSTWEEIDKLVPGGNYGWNESEGFATTVPPTGLGPGTYQDPQLAYNHSGGPAGGGIAIIGGAFYDPPAGAANPFPASFTGKYFYADLGSDWIRVFDPANPGSLSNPDTSAGFATGAVGSPVGMALASDGGLYYLAQGNGGELLKISFTQTLDNANFVHNLYHDVLNRAPDPQGNALVGFSVEWWNISTTSVHVLLAKRRASSARDQRVLSKHLGPGAGRSREFRHHGHVARRRHGTVRRANFPEFDRVQERPCRQYELCQCAV